MELKTWGRLKVILATAFSMEKSMCVIVLLVIERHFSSLDVIGRHFLSLVVIERHWMISMMRKDSQCIQRDFQKPISGYFGIPGACVFLKEVKNPV
jgi:hypothetical protein